MSPTQRLTQDMAELTWCVAQAAMRRLIWDLHWYLGTYFFCRNFTNEEVNYNLQFSPVTESSEQSESGGSEESAEVPMIK